MTTTCPTCEREDNTIVSGVSCPFCVLAASAWHDWLDALSDYEANQRYAEAQWARSGTNYSDWYTGDRGR